VQRLTLAVSAKIFVFQGTEAGKVLYQLCSLLFCHWTSNLQMRP